LGTTIRKSVDIPPDAPFSAEQRSWISGFLAGLASDLGAGGGDRAPAASVKPLTILYGTQTGTAEMLAEDAGQVARSRGFTPRIAELNDIGMDDLATMENVIVVVSTYGEGEMPDSARIFWDSLSATTAPRLENLNYGILALGDTSYEFFCQAGKLLDTRLEQLGAHRMLERVDCDLDYEDAAATWIAQAIPDAGGAPAPETARKTGWGRKHPYIAGILENRVLSGAKSAKEIRHIAFDLGDSGITYDAGDALGVMPVNAPDLVDAWLVRLGAKADTAIPGQGLPLGPLLATRFEITTPSRDLIRMLEVRAGHEELSHVVNHRDKAVLEHFMWGRDTLDLLNLNPDLVLDPAELVSWLKPLQHRAYSISSSPKAHPGEVHLTVAAVRWMFEGRAHRGVCSTFLADQEPEGAQAGIFMIPNTSFRVPEDDAAPMLMIGPGTGLAPFRAFLEERRARGASGTNWLFFGDQHRASDFIYEDEIGAFSADGTLTRLDLAFSRDQTEKIYVQHRMIENGKDIFALLEDGGHFYVCGDATRMAKDVDAALHSIIETFGNMDADAAITYVNGLRKDKRYLRDVY